MAKIGETDERWIVSKRTDGRNVDNWHWSEKNLLPWLKERLSEVLRSITLKDQTGFRLCIDAMDSVTGDYVVYNRKQKLLYVYDLTIVLKWTASIEKDGKPSEVTGEVIVEDIDQDGVYHFKIKVKTGSDERDVIRNQIKVSFPMISEKIKSVVEGMQDVASTVQLTVAEQEVITPAIPVVVSPTQSPVVQSSSVASSEASNDRSGAGLTTVKLKVKFTMPPAQVYDFLTDPAKMSALSGSSAQLTPVPNAPFSLFNGMITGKMISLTKGKEIVQTWRNQSWPAGVYSEVRLTLESTPKEDTHLTLVQTGVPKEEYTRTRAGWEEYYWRRMASLLGIRHTEL